MSDDIVATGALGRIRRELDATDQAIVGDDEIATRVAERRSRSADVRCVARFGIHWLTVRARGEGLDRRGVSAVKTV